MLTCLPTVVRWPSLHSGLLGHKSPYLASHEYREDSRGSACVENRVMFEQKQVAADGRVAAGCVLCPHVIPKRDYVARFSTTT